MSKYPCSPGTPQHWIHQPSDSYLFRGDHHCSYNIFPYEVDPENEMVIHGRYPYAAYFSITVIGELNLFVASAVDHELMPDPGSTNPFLPGANWDAKNRSYTLKVRFTAPPEGSDHFIPGAGNNIIYAGTLTNGAPNRHGLVVLRIYAASIGYDKKTGGVGFPAITYCAARPYPGQGTQLKNRDAMPGEFHGPRQRNSPERSQMTFNDYAGSHNVANDNTTNSQDMTASHGCDLTWRTISRIAELIHPDSNTVYIISDQLHREPGHLLVIRWKAPTFPDTYHNIGIHA